MNGRPSKVALPKLRECIRRLLCAGADPTVEASLEGTFHESQIENVLGTGSKVILRGLKSNAAVHS